MRKNIIYLSLFLIGVLGCKKKTHDLPAPDPAVIEAIKIDDNTYVFRNATPSGGAGSLWNFSGIEDSVSTQYRDTVFFAFPGIYNISLTSNSKGGLSTASTNVQIDKISVYAANFTIEELDTYHFKVSVITPNAINQVFKYSIGLNDSSSVDTAYFPFSGNQSISATVKVRQGGRVFSSTMRKNVTVANDDLSNPKLTDPIFKLLTGGLDDVDGRTWVMSTLTSLPGHGVYGGKYVQGKGIWKRKRIELDYWTYDSLGGFLADPAWRDGLLKNEFTFTMRNYGFIPLNKKCTVNWLVANRELHMSRPDNSDVAYEHPDLRKASFVMNTLNPPDGIIKANLEFNNPTFLGVFDNRFKYEIVEIRLDPISKRDSVWVRNKYSDNKDDYSNPAKDATARTILYVAKD